MAGALDEANGSGWIITLVETMRAEWGLTLHQALFKESLTASLALWPCMMARHGAEVHFDYGDQARQDGKEAMKQWIADHFTIDPRKPPPPEFMKRSLPPTADGSQPPL